VSFSSFSYWLTMLYLHYVRLTFMHNVRNRSAATAGKFAVRLSPLAYNLLSLFLVQSDLVLIASIINNKVTFKKLDDARLAVDGEVAQAEELLLVELPGYTPGTGHYAVRL
jgi:hypothetical protein